MNSQTEHARTHARNAQTASRSGRTGTEETRGESGCFWVFSETGTTRTEHGMSFRKPRRRRRRAFWETEMITEALCRFFARGDGALSHKKGTRGLGRRKCHAACLLESPHRGHSRRAERGGDVRHHGRRGGGMPEEGSALLDITHGFRSLPALMLFAVFLRHGGQEDRRGIISTAPFASAHRGGKGDHSRSAHGSSALSDAPGPGISHLPGCRHSSFAAVDLAKRKWKSPLVGKARTASPAWGPPCGRGSFPCCTAAWATSTAPCRR
jgi:CRISPR-associated DxTHG motif protein